MATKAVIHTATRFILVITKDPEYQIPSGFSSVDVPDDFDLGGGPWKLHAGNVTKLEPTQAEIDQVQDTLQPKRVKMRNLKQKLDAITNRASLPVEVREFAQALKDLWD